MYGIITTVNKARLGAVRWQNRARRSRDAVKEELRMKKRNRLTICLVAGVLILAVSATAENVFVDPKGGLWERQWVQ